MEKTFKAFAQGERNKAAAQLAGYRYLPLFDGLIRPQRPGEHNPSDRTFSYLADGEKHTFVTTPEIASAAKSLDVHSIGLLGRIAAVPARIFKLFTTGINPRFILSNILADVGHTAVTSQYDNSLANPAVFFGSMMSALKQDANWKEMVREGGGFSSFDLYRNSPEMTIESIRSKRNPRARAAYIVRHPINGMGDLFREVEDIVSRSEGVGRLRLYTATKSSLLNAKRTPEDAKRIAVVEANNALPNYMRQGNRVRPFNAITPYLNAGVQGSRSFLRGFERNPKGTIARIVIALLFPTAMATLWNLSDPDRARVYMDIQKSELDNNIVIVSNGSQKDDQNRWDVVKLKLPQGLANLTIPLRRMIESAYGLDPVNFAEIANAAIGSVSPIEPTPNSVMSTVIPQIGKPTVQAATNKDFFRDKPKVPERLQHLPPEMQVLPYTSGTAEKIGNALGISPILTEEFIKDTFGGGGPPILNASDRLLAAAGQIPADKIGGTDVVTAITERFGKARGGELAAREFKARTDLEQKLIREAVDRAKDTAFYATISSNKEMTQRYLDTVATRAKALITEITGSDKYKRMEAPEQLEELNRVAPTLLLRATSSSITETIPRPVVPPSEDGRYQY
jgi:hypothetical protein